MMLLIFDLLFIIVVRNGLWLGISELWILLLMRIMVIGESD